MKEILELVKYYCELNNESIENVCLNIYMDESGELIDTETYCTIFDFNSIKELKEKLTP